MQDNDIEGSDTLSNENQLPSPHVVVLQKGRLLLHKSKCGMNHLQALEAGCLGSDGVWLWTRSFLSLCLHLRSLSGWEDILHSLVVIKMTWANPWSPRSVSGTQHSTSTIIFIGGVVIPVLTLKSCVFLDLLRFDYFISIIGKIHLLLNNYVEQWHICLMWTSTGSL